MCYSYKVIWSEDKSKHFKVPHRQFQKMSQTGQIKRTDGDFIFFPQNQVPVVVNSREGRPMLTPMHWDLLPRWFEGESKDQLDLISGDAVLLDDVLKEKKFHSYNARIESIHEKAAFRSPWEEGKRCLLPVSSFWEHSNMVAAPSDLKGVAHEFLVSGECALGGVYDVWQGSQLQSSGVINEVKFPSVSVVTASGLDHPTMQKVFHDRTPVLIPQSNYEEWLSPAVSVNRAKEMALCLGEFTLKEVVS